MQVNFDLARMKKSLESGFVTLPNGLNREELRAWLKAQAEEKKK